MIRLTRLFFLVSFFIVSAGAIPAFSDTPSRVKATSHKRIEQPAPPVLDLPVQARIDSVTVTLSEIKVSGNERVEKATVLSYLPFKVGGKISETDLSMVVKRLYNTGLFNKVDVALNSGILAITVQENPLVNKVAFEGNDKIVSQRLVDVVSLAPRAIYTPAKIQKDVQNLLSAYRARGRFLTEIRPQVIPRDQNRVDVVFVIKEGEKTKIEDIRFVGNTRFTDRDLRAVIATKQSAWFRFLSTADSYDPNRISVDKELLRRYYIQYGYADFQVTSGVAELSPDKTGFYITYTVLEGPVYDFGTATVNVSEQAEGVDANALQDTITLKPGEVYNAIRVEKTIADMVDTLGENGFAFLDVRPSFIKNEAQRTVDTIFNIQPGPRVYVDRINIEGNTRTRDYVLRREMKLIEGDAYSATKLKRSKDRLTYLGFFETVDITPSQTEEPDRMDLTVKVKEASTGQFNLGAGFSTYEGMLATADVKERNFLGKGQIVAVKFSLSGIKQNFNLSFTEPYFMGRNISAGVRAFNEKRDYRSESSYDLDTSGAALSFKLPVNEFSSYAMQLGYKSTTISDVGSRASSLVSRETGKRNSLYLSNTFSEDTRDSYLDPTRGHRYAITADYSGFGSDVNYIKTIASGSWHKELKEDYILSFGARAGAIWNMDEDLPIYEHFSAGGANLRGFDLRGIGPRDNVTGDSLGGMYMLGNNAELTFPLPGSKDLGVKGILFTDGGIVTEFEGATSTVTDSQTYRLSAGVGLHWKSPVGPLRLEFGIPLVKAKEDRTKIFNFSVGARF